MVSHSVFDKKNKEQMSIDVCVCMYVLCTEPNDLKDSYLI